MPRDIEVYADEFEDVQRFIYSPAYQESLREPDACKGCGGDGYFVLFAGPVEDIFGNTYQDEIKERCDHCSGTGVEPELEAA